MPDRSESEVRETIKSIEALLRNTSDETARKELERDLDIARAELGRIYAARAETRAGRAWEATKKHGPTVAAGAAGVAVGAAAATHNAAKRGLQTAANSAGYMKRKTGEAIGSIPNATPFFLIAAVLYAWIYLSGALKHANYTWMLFVAIALGVLHYFMFRGYGPDLQRTGQFLIFGPTVIIMFLAMLGGAFGSEELLERPIIKEMIVLFYPAILWWMAISGRYEIGRPIKFVGTAAIALIAIVYLSPAVPTLVDLWDIPSTGIDLGEAFHDIGQRFAQAIGAGSNGLLCTIGWEQGCGFAGWLNEQIAPFAYDATAVHELQNRDLGVFITEVDDNKRFSVSPQQSFDFLPSGVNFKIKAPIPQDLEFEFCGVQNSELKGFPGVCNNTIILSCDADVGATKIEPRDTLSVSQAVSSQGTLFTCRLSPPTENIRSTEVTIKAQYPFVTNTYKLLRAVDGSTSLSNEQVRELESFQEDFIVSTGGPVIVETDESNFLSISSDGQREQLILTLKAQPDVRLEAVDSIQVYVPDGARLESRPESLCAVEPVRLDNSSEVNCAGFKDECVYAQIYTPSQVGMESIPACRAYDECRAGDYTTRSGSIYRITSTEDISVALGSTRGTGNEVQIGCEINIHDRNEFLYENQLVTERALNIIARYDVEHQQTSRITFDGTPPRFPISSFSGTSETCKVSDPSLSIPTGIVPVTISPSITQTFGASDTDKDGHRGVDFDLEIGNDVIAAWSGKVMLVCGDGLPKCEDRWSSFGNMVVIRTKTQNGVSFDHIYAHLNSIAVSKDNEVSQGQRIGKGGNTGKVRPGPGGDGSHLHFELRENYIEKFSNFDPLPHIYSEELAKNSRYQEARRAVSCQPVISYSDRDTQEARDKAIAAIEKITDPTPEQIQNVERIIGAAKRFGVPVEVALGVAWQENTGFKHTEGGKVKLSSSGDIGLMQINHRRDNGSDTGITYCDDMTRSTGHEPLGVVTEDIEYTRLLMKPDFNALCGMEILKDKYDNNARLLRTYGLICGTSDGCVEGSECANLTGWKAATKAYNGWSCGADALDYPNSVEEHITETFELKLPSGWT